MVLDNVNINRDITNLSMTRGDTLAFGFEIEGLGGRQIDNAYFSVKYNRRASTYAFQLSLEEGQIINEGDGLYSVRAQPGFTEDLEPDTYYYDLQVEIGDDVFTIMSGKLFIKKGITED